MKKLFILIGMSIFLSCNHEAKLDNEKIDLDAEKIKVELDSIMVLDQLHRKKLEALYAEKKHETQEFKNMVQEQIKIDSMNLIYVEDLIKKYGKYPGSSFVGQSAGKVSFYVLQHAPDSIQAKYIDIVLDAAEINEVKKGQAAMYHDRYLLIQGKPQIYGTQVKRKKIVDSESGEESFIWVSEPILDTVNIDSLRLWNGLGSLEDYLNRFGASRWDPQ